MKSNKENWIYFPLKAELEFHKKKSRKISSTLPSAPRGLWLILFIVFLCFELRIFHCDINFFLPISSYHHRSSQGHFSPFFSFHSRPARDFVINFGTKQATQHQFSTLISSSEWYYVINDMIIWNDSNSVGYRWISSLPAPPPLPQQSLCDSHQNDFVSLYFFFLYFFHRSLLTRNVMGERFLCCLCCWYHKTFISHQNWFAFSSFLDC